MIELDGDEVLLLRQTHWGDWCALARGTEGRFSQFYYRVVRLGGDESSDGPYGDMAVAYSVFTEKIYGKKMELA